MPLVLTALCVLAAIGYIQDVWRAAREPLLEPGAGLPVDGPLISVLIPARDEAARIGACLAGLAGQSYQRFETIVIDDHSSDETAAVALRYAERLPSLAVMRGAVLPPGWAGKCWACWQAAGRARGEWLLFLDADVIPRPALLAALVTHAEACRLDLLSLLPLPRLGSPAEYTVLPAFMSLLYGLYPLDRVGDPRSPIAFANGQCFLVRRDVYHATGGHQAVHASILEDTHFGQRVKAAGYRIAAAAAPDLIAVRMYTGWRTLAEGLTKNAVAGYRSGGRRSAWVGARQALLAFLPWYQLAGGALLAAMRPGDPLATALLIQGGMLALIALAGWGWIARRRYRIGAGWGALFPLGTAIYFGLAARALLRLRRGQGVVWKGRMLV